MKLCRPQNPGHVRLTAIAGAALGVLMILLLRRYVGINHDAVLYLGQGLVRRWPEIYLNDLAFVHGRGQDQYTLFPLLLSHALNWAKPATLFMWGALASLLCFAAASWFCLKALLPPAKRYWAWLGVLCLPTMYGMIQMFGYSEQFFTPRPIAEALCVIGIGLLARRRWILAPLCLALAGLLHPLQSIAACIVIWPWLIIQDRRWLHVSWLAIPLLALSLGGVEPFAGLLHQADEEWLFILRDNTPQLFLTRWGLSDFNYLLLDALILAYCRHALRGEFGTWCAAALAGLALGMGASLLLVDGLHLVLPAGLQIWRVHWLAHWFAMAGVAALLYRDLRAGDFTRVLVLSLGLLTAWGLANFVWLLLILLYAVWPALGAAHYARMRWLLGWLCGAGIGILVASYVSTELILFRMAHYRLDLYAFDRRVLVHPFLALGLPVIGIYVWSRLASKARIVVIGGLLAPLLAIGVVRWDSRPPEVLAFERATFRSDIFGVEIPKGAQVIWGYDTLTGPWLVLQRASFVSPHQLSGQVFSREMALDARRRLNRMYPLLNDFRACLDRSTPIGDRQRCHISDEAMLRACFPGPDPNPDFIVLPFLQPQRPLGSWKIIDPVTNDIGDTFNLYRCTDVMRDLRRAATDPTGTASQLRH